MGDEEIDADGAAEWNQLGVGNKLRRQNCPITNQQNDRRDKHGGDPCLGQDGHCIAYQVGYGAQNERQCKVVHILFLLFLFIYSTPADVPYRMNKYAGIIAPRGGNVKDFSNLKRKFFKDFRHDKS